MSITTTFRCGDCGYTVPECERADAGGAQCLSCEHIAMELEDKALRRGLSAEEAKRYAEADREANRPHPEGSAWAADLIAEALSPARSVPLDSCGTALDLEEAKWRRQIQAADGARAPVAEALEEIERIQERRRELIRRDEREEEARARAGAADACCMVRERERERERVRKVFPDASILTDPGPDERHPTTPELERTGRKVAAEADAMYERYIAAGGKPFHAMGEVK